MEATTEKTVMTKKQFIIYMIVTFVPAWILQVIGSVFANNGDQLTFGALITVVMYMPFLGTLIARVPLKGMGWIPHLKGRVRYVFFALWMPALLSILGGILFFVIFPDTFDSEFLTLRGMLESNGAWAQMEAQGMTVPLYILIATIGSVTYGPFISMPVTLGEEVGWRGALYPYLKEKLGVTKGRIAGGLIWGVWHWPLMIMAGYEYGKEYIGAPVLGPIVFCISTVMLGILCDFVYEKTELIWVPSLMHGAVNAFTIFAYLTKPEYAQTLQPAYSRLALLGPAYIGIIGMIPMIIAVVIICLKQAKK